MIVVANAIVVDVIAAVHVVLLRCASIGILAVVDENSGALNIGCNLFDNSAEVGMGRPTAGHESLVSSDGTGRYGSIDPEMPHRWLECDPWFLLGESWR